MSADVEIGVDGRAGIITLNREKAINALTGQMIATISIALEDWEDDPAIAMVLIEGRGDKGLCAGGDVRAAREMVIAGKSGEVLAYFEDEYRMNGLIATYAKPIVALQHGFVMGGGIGLSSHARYRIATHTSRFAMPEAAIGFFSDVGVNAILYQTPEHRALAFLMIGTAVERQGIIRAGAKMSSAVSESTVPKLSVIVRKAYGAGLYAMAGPAYDPDCCLALPTASIAVMGPQAAINAVFHNQLQAIEDPGERERRTEELRREYAAEIDILHLASELVVDAVIQPDTLREELIKRFAVYAGKRREWPAKRNPVTPV
jgi:enoyl-CoA hydratase/carnithine racemase